MTELTVGDNPRWPVPALDFRGVPCGIDVRSVIQTRTTPAINTGIAHRRAGIGQVGAGIARAPMGCFEQALAAIAESLERAQPTP